MNTLIYFDFETTGLETKAKVTEASFAAMPISLLTPNSSTDGKDGLPRVLPKLTFLLNPGKFIGSIASETTGLYNDMLEHLNKFSSDHVQLIEKFLLSSGPPPWCLIAHNGNRFDFPILAAQINAADGFSEGFPAAQVFVVDSLTAFKEIDAQIERIAVENDEVDEMLEQVAAEALDDTLGTIETSIADSPCANDSTLPQVTPVKNDSSLNDSGIQANGSPVSKISAGVNRVLNLDDSGFGESPSNGSLSRDAPTSVPHTPPTKFSRPAATSTPKKTTRQLLPGNPAKMKKPSYTLKAVYCRSFPDRSEPVFHRSEADIIAMLEITRVYGKNFEAYVNDNAVPFSTVKPRY